MKNKKKTGMGCLIVIIIMIMLGLFFNSIMNQSESSIFSQTGYFKNEHNWRIFSVQIKPNKIKKDSLFLMMKKYAIKEPHTKGRITHVFFFKTKAPDITIARTFDNAYERCIQNNPYYLFSIGRKGDISFVKNPKD